jgi:GR25 family glycosyltransferase involved in LPS biosynthesis
MIKGFIITLDTNQESIEASHKCIGSIRSTKSEIDPSVFVATVPRQIKRHLDEIDMGGIIWTYPLTKEEDGLDIKTGLYLRHYPTKKISNRTACAVSHMRLWHKCATGKKPIIILEHDAVFTRKFVFEPLEGDFKGGILGLNDPRGATRRSDVFHNIASSKMGLQPVPTVDDMEVPQGLAGNSAYLITPTAAKKLLDKVREVGIWANDALMCKQFFPWMQVVYPYYTTIQRGLKSTTTS